MKYSQELLDFLTNHLTQERKELFEAIAPKRTRYVTAVVEDLFQPHNASAVMRSCDCFGIQDMHIIENKNKFSPNKEIAMGSSKWLDLKRYNKAETNNTFDCIEKLKSNGYQIVATTPHTDNFDLETLPIDKPLALFFGTEKSGLTDNVMQRADAFVRIPMFGFTESFNISVSAALSLNSVMNRVRKDDNIQWQLSDKELLELKTNWTIRTLKSADQLIDRFYREAELS